MPAENSTSCISKKPFMEIGTENAPLLDYKLPQTNGFHVNSPLEIPLDDTDFKDTPGIRQKPTNGYFDQINVPAGEVTSLQNQIAVNIANNFVVNTGEAVAITGGTESVVYMTGGDLGVSAITNFGTSSVQLDKQIANVQIVEVAKLAAEAFPIISTNMAGQQYVTYLPDPITAKPALFMIEKFRVETYLGNYGAGETVKTFSLLPGEKTTISVKTYKQTVKSKKDISNVLDSFNQETSNELEKMLEGEASSSKEKERSAEIGKQTTLSATIPVKAISLGISSMSSMKAAAKNIRKESQRTLSRNIDKQVQKSIVNRKVEVNTEKSENETNSEENSIVRVLENINKSRVLNFIFRQLNQQMITVTYLEDVSFYFSNGYPESVRKCGLAELKNLLDDILVPAKVEPVFKDIINSLHNYDDFQGSPKPFVEKITKPYEDIFATPTAITNHESFDRSSNLLSEIPSTGSFSQDGQNIKVNGIIADITLRTLPTDSVIVDALLGHGEALDCFNLHLQESAIQEAKLNNDIKQQTIDIINAITDPAEKASLYKKVFGDCCDVPQVGCNCIEQSNPA
jgi:hypothetical protein